MRGKENRLTEMSLSPNPRLKYTSVTLLEFVCETAALLGTRSSKLLLKLG